MASEGAFDYIIIGAGSAGCVLANRLSADPAISVLLLEAGRSDRHPYIKVPAAFSKLFRSPRDWAFRSEPNPGFNDRSVFIPRGKTIGGSSSINALIYIRGNRADFDGWATAGNDGWSYDDVLPYFKKSEHNERLADEFHGQGGPLNISDLPAPNPLTETFIQGCEETGIDRINDFNGATQIGASRFQVNQKNGRRWSSADAFLRPAGARRNLSIRTRATVTSISLQKHRARSVNFLVGTRQESATASAEVLLCAGAIGSPQILMLSGVGPPEHLRELGIDVTESLPVGIGLQDHPAVPVIYDCNQAITLDDIDHPKYLLRYLADRGGKLRSNISEAGAFVSTASTKRAPDVQFHFGPLYFGDHGFTRYDGNAFSIGPTLVDVASRGTVSLASTDPRAPARIEGNYLTESSDITALVAGVRWAREIGQSNSFSPFRGQELSPGPEVVTDDEIRAFIRQTAELIYHPTSTCPMGVDDNAVVDPTLKVRGIDNLRVVDASVMPKIVTGNTNAATVMIAEKAAEMILQ